MIDIPQGEWARYHLSKQFPDAWVQTYTGGMFWPLEPDIELISIEDIAWALSQQCRYTGHCHRFYSVAEHSLRLMAAASSPNQLWALLHDAPEAYLSDIARPIKSAVTGYREIEERLERAIANRFGLSPVMPDEVKALDLSILEDERQALMAEAPMTWCAGPPIGIADEIRNSPMNSKQAFCQFLQSFQELKLPLS